MATPVDTVLFDLDDTLCTYRRGADEVLELAFRAVGVDPLFEPAAYYGRYREYLVASTDIDDLHARCFGDLAAEAGYDREAGVAVARAFGEERDQRNVDLLPGARRAVELLAREHALGLVTNGGPKMQRQKLAALDLDDAFDIVVCAGYDAAAKPDPEPFDLALEALDSTHDGAVYVGNSLASDVAGADAAGIRSVWVPLEAEPVASPEPTPDYTLESLAELRTPPWR